MAILHLEAAPKSDSTQNNTNFMPKKRRGSLASKLPLLNMEKPLAGPLIDDYCRERVNVLAAECGKVCFHKASQVLGKLVSQRNARTRQMLERTSVKTYLDGVEYLEHHPHEELNALLSVVEDEMNITGLREQAGTFLECVRNRDTYEHFTKKGLEDRERHICMVEVALEERTDIICELKECTPAITYGAELIRNGYLAFRQENKPVEFVRPAIELMNQLNHFSLGELMKEVLIFIPFVDRSSHSYKAWKIYWKDEFFHVHEQDKIVLAGLRLGHKLFVAVKNQVMKFELKDGMFILTHEKIEIPQAEHLVIKNGTNLPVALYEMLHKGGLFILHGVHAAAAAWVVAQAHGVGWGFSNVIFAGSAIHNMALFLFCQRVFLATVGTQWWTLPPPSPLTKTTEVFLGTPPTTRQSDVKRVLEVVQLVERILRLQTPKESMILELLVTLVDDWEAEAFLADFVSDVTFAVLNWGNGTESKKEIRGVINSLWSSFASHGIRKNGEICGASVLEYEEQNKKEKEREKGLMIM